MTIIALRKENTFAKDLLSILVAGAFITLIGQLSIPLPFTPVPIAFRLQTILFLGLLLGSRRALLAVGIFIALSAPLLLGPTAGYIVGYILAAAFIRQERPVYSFVIGTLVVYLCGFAYLSTILGVQKAFLLGIAPFILGDIIKSIIALKLLKYVQLRRN
ncbi:MAG TPA: biotin transporter BioY [Chlamydiales bacterium]|nr:biotin transporter BioY [Chlamydiales bacterium]